MDAKQTCQGFDIGAFGQYLQEKFARFFANEL